MALGLSTVNLVNKILDHLRGGTAWTQPSGLYVKLHTTAGDPGAAGTANPSAVTSRQHATFAAASGGAIALSGSNPGFAMTATETIGSVSVWDDDTAGNFQWSAPLSASKSVASGDTLTITALGLALSPLAA